MPHVDGMSLPRDWTRGQSRFARPVAAVTEFVRSVSATLKYTAVRRGKRKDADLEAHYAHASDHQALEIMEREWDRRDGGGVRTW